LALAYTTACTTVQAMIPVLHRTTSCNFQDIQAPK